MKDRILWCVVQRNGRGTEWMLTHTLAPSKLGAKNLWCDPIAWAGHEDIRKVFSKRLKDGSLRFAKVLVGEIPQ